MSKNKRTVPPVKPGPAARTAVASRPAPTTAWPAFLTDVRLQSVIVFALAFVLYANTLAHEFTLDDSIVITDNMFTQQGIKGIPGILTKDTFFGFFKVEGKETLVSGGRYRPLTLVLFALIYQIAGSTPFVFHFVTVLLYALTCLVLYRALVRLVAGSEAFAGTADSTAAVVPVGILTAFLAAVLFTVHPVHTEVVANIKGCDEILTLLLCVLALDFALRAYDSGRGQWALAAGGAFFLACLSKENAAAFVFIIPLALYTRQRSRDGASVVASSWPVWAAFLLFFIIRGSILNWRFGGEPMELMNNPFLKIENGQWVKFDAGERLGTIFYTLGRYVQLLVWPHPLTHDYYPRHIGIKTLGDPLALLSAVGYLALGLYGAVSLLLRRSLVGLGILWYLLALSIVSNFVFPIGTNMGERFAFMPSAGFCLAVAVLLCGTQRPDAAQRGWQTPAMVIGAVAVIFSGLTFVRNFDWSSNENLFLTDVHKSPNSAKIRNAAGGVLFDKARAEDDAEKRRLLAGQSLEHINKAIEIYPNYKDAYITRGGDHFFLGNYAQAAADYRMALQYTPGDERITQSLAMVLREAGKEAGEKRGDAMGAEKLLREAWGVNSKDAETARLLGVATGIQGKNAEALQWFARAVELDPKNASYLFDLGTATAINGDLAKGEALRQQAIQMDPKLAEKK